MVRLDECIFFIIDDDLLEKYNTIWYNVSANIKKEFHSEHAYNKKFLKTKMLSYGYRFSL